VVEGLRGVREEDDVRREGVKRGIVSVRVPFSYVVVVVKLPERMDGVLG
jgi:hypothetical protein